MNQDDTMTLPLLITEADVRRFFLRNEKSSRRIKSLIGNVQIQFETYVFEDLQEKVKGTELADEEIFKNRRVMQEVFNKAVEINSFYKAIKNFANDGIQITDENTVKFLSESYIMSVMRAYRETLILLVEAYEEGTKTLEETRDSLCNGNLIN